MSLLAQQVAGLMHAYHPPLPTTGRVHRIQDDEDQTERNESARKCSKCFEWKPADDYYMRADGRRYGFCRICAAKQARELKAKKK